jgi:hypothetical protein
MALPIIDPVIFALVLTLTGPGAQPPPEPATAKFAVPRSKGRRPVRLLRPPQALDLSAVRPSAPHFAAAPQPQERMPSHVEVY